MADQPLRLMVIGAHPDDAEFKAGGLAALYRGLGHIVRFVSVTDGSAGHHLQAGPGLAARRKEEAAAAGGVVGLEYEVWDYPDGRLAVTLEARERVIGAIRSFQPDLVLTHRPNDYHPDHRAVSQLVLDAAYLLTVPAIRPDVPHLRRDPVLMFLSDDFTRPCPFEPSVIVDITEVWDAKVAMLHAHTSQFYEWLPYNAGHEAEVPDSDVERRAWLSGRMVGLSRQLADSYRPALVAALGEDRGGKLDRIEAFEAGEHGTRLDDSGRRRLFPFTRCA